MTGFNPPVCPEQKRLVEVVQQHLIRIAALSRAMAKAMSNRNENLTRELDKEIENEIGAKQRALGALRQHREEHGC